MNADEFERTLDVYQARLTEENDGKWEPDTKVPGSFSSRSPHKRTRTLHLQSMILKMHDLLKEGREGKFYRWLGFMQGILWVRGIYSLDELRAHNRGKCSDPDIYASVVDSIIAIAEEAGHCQFCTHDGSGYHDDGCPMSALLRPDQ